MIASGKLTIALWLMVVASAFAVIAASHESRQAFIEWQALLKQAQEYDVEWGQLLIQKSSSASYTRLEALAEEKLQMKAPGKEQMVIVRGKAQ